MAQYLHIFILWMILLLCGSILAYFYSYKQDNDATMFGSRFKSKYRSKHRLYSQSYGMPTRYYDNKDISATTSSPCLLLGADKCLEYIELITGVEPRLISFKQEVVQAARHPDTGLPFLVPNIVHYINFNIGREPFQFYHYVSYKGSDKFMKPALIILWGNTYSGKLWDKMLSEVPNVYYVHVTASSTLFGRQYRWVQHLSDVLRISVLRGKCHGKSVR